MGIWDDDAAVAAMADADAYDRQIEQAEERLARLMWLYKVEGQLLGLIPDTSPAYKVTVDRMQAIAELMRGAERAIQAMKG